MSSAGKFPAILDDPKVGAAATSLYADARAMLRRIVEERWFRASAVAGFWPANAKGDDILNEINVAGLKKRAQMQQEGATARRAEARATLVSGEAHPSYPSDLDEAAVRKIIEGCSYFQDRVTVEIPKQFQVNMYSWILDRYPSLPAAALEHLIEFDPPFDIEHAGHRVPNPAQPSMKAPKANATSIIWRRPSSVR